LERGAGARLLRRRQTAQLRPLPQLPEVPASTPDLTDAEIEAWVVHLETECLKGAAPDAALVAAHLRYLQAELLLTAHRGDSTHDPRAPSEADKPAIVAAVGP
jgi:hypothetical protein